MTDIKLRDYQCAVVDAIKLGRLFPDTFVREQMQAYVDLEDRQRPLKSFSTKLAMQWPLGAGKASYKPRRSTYSSELEVVHCLPPLTRTCHAIRLVLKDWVRG